jgi:hypothetical protein
VQEEKEDTVAYRGKMRKQSKLPETITFSSELRFEKTNSHWKGIEEENPYINPRIWTSAFFSS